MRAFVKIPFAGGFAILSAVFLTTVAPPAALVSTSASAQPAVPTCPTNATQYRSSGQTITCSCSGSATTTGSVWGTDIYTDDSKICRAARHAGVIGASGGTVQFQMVAGQTSYRATSRNGVSSTRYGNWGGSYRFTAVRQTAPLGPTNIGTCPNSATAYRGRSNVLVCSCSAAATASGSVWGTSVYTDDSKICRAAVHAGIIGASGGSVALRMAPGRSSYSGTRRNEVNSNRYGAWGGSYRFVSGSSAGVSTPPVASTRTCPSNATQYRGTGQRITCTCTASAAATGSVWGTATYTDDSKICRAALHAAKIGSGGGEVTFRMVGGRDRYLGTSSNGVSSSRYGKWSGSFRFE